MKKQYVKIILIITVLLIFLIGCDTGTNPTSSNPTDTNQNGQEIPVIKIYFSPADKCDEKIVALIDSAKQELNIAVYSFNRQNIADAVINAYKRGVAVRVVFDESQLTGPNSKQDYLQNAGIAVKKDKPAGGNTADA